jgi:hypothetical protein
MDHPPAPTPGAPRRSTRGRRLGRVIRLAAGAVVIAMLLVGWSPGAPARADDSSSLQVSPLRRQMPIKAGTHLAMGSGNCTAGAVLYRSDLTQRVTQFLRATRYVVTAKHCGGIGTPVFVNGELAGAVTYVSPDLDFSIIAVTPRSETVRHCSVSVSGVPSCYPITTYAPRALGKVFLGGNGLAFGPPGAGGGPRPPGPGEDFCTSGAISGWECGWRSTRPDAAAREFDRTAVNYFGGALPGDSGGPVVDRTGHLLGIIRGGAVATTLHPGELDYTSMTTVLAELSSYRLVQD